MYRLIRPLLFRMPPESAHRLVVGLLAALGPLARLAARTVGGRQDPILATSVGPLTWPSPIGLAAGLDKDGRLSRFWPALGFGAVELGTVTALAQPGNPRPRMFRIPAAQALVNRMGFNNAGSEALARRLTGLTLDVPLGINLGKSKVCALKDAASDYAASARRVARRCDYLVINVSSPNTPGLRRLQDAGFLAEITATVVAESRGRPVFVKLAPDLQNAAVTEAVEVAERHGAAGIIATNTTILRPGIDRATQARLGAGGLSGRPLQPRALAVIRRVARATALPVIGVGGISDLAGVQAALAAGASAVQLFSALIYEGPGLPARLNRALAADMRARGIHNMDEYRQALRG